MSAGSGELHASRLAAGTVISSGVLRTLMEACRIVKAISVLGDKGANPFLFSLIDLHQRDSTSDWVRH
eukprot:15367175-Ditylum_brightwellii.AAC.1